MKKTLGLQRIVITGEVFTAPSVIKKIDLLDVLAALKRHRRGDWGNVSESDRERNDFALQNGGRLLSIYEGKEKNRFWIITKADRSSTTVLLPSDD